MRILSALVWGSIGLLVALVILNLFLNVVRMVPGTAGAVGTAKRWAGLNG